MNSQVRVLRAAGECVSAVRPTIAAEGLAAVWLLQSEVEFGHAQAAERVVRRSVFTIDGRISVERNSRRIRLREADFRKDGKTVHRSCGSYDKTSGGLVSPSRLGELQVAACRPSKSLETVGLETRWPMFCGSLAVGLTDAVWNSSTVRAFRGRIDPFDG